MTAEQRHNVAVIFGGGVGRRMKSSTRPKQFLTLFGKPIIAYTIEHFQNHPDIDAIAVVSLDSWREHVKELIEQYGLSKVRWVVPGGDTGQESIYNGLAAVAADLPPELTTVLVHDAVRPLITAELISANLASFKAHGNGVTAATATETIVIIDDDGTVRDITDRHNSRLARAPQTFALDQLLKAHLDARARGESDWIDSCTLMRANGHAIHLVDGPPENIKVTTPTDYSLLRAYLDTQELFEAYDR